VEVRFLDHAVSRMFERGISPEEVESILLKPDGKIEQSQDKAILYKSIRGRKDNNIAIVVVKDEKSFFTVVTVMINFEVNK